MSRIPVWTIHLLTASGAAFALGAAVAAARESWQLVFICLGAALIVDGVDGPLARWLKVSERLPWFDGAALDFVVDYVNYVFIPAFVLAQGGLITEPWATVSGVVVAVVGALYFADKRMKTADLGFRGFPAVWNTVVFVLMIYRPPEILTLAIIAVFAVLTFSPVEFVHPVRVKRMRPLTLLMTLAWSVLAVIALLDNLDPGLGVRIALFVTTAYLTVIGAVLQLTRERDRWE
jgi:phosphatidylcholine synthase